MMARNVQRKTNRRTAHAEMHINSTRLVNFIVCAEVVIYGEKAILLMHACEVNNVLRRIPSVRPYVNLATRPLSFRVLFWKIPRLRHV